MGNVVTLTVTADELAMNRGCGYPETIESWELQDLTGRLVYTEGAVTFFSLSLCLHNVFVMTLALCGVIEPKPRRRLKVPSAST